MDSFDLDKLMLNSYVDGGGGWTWKVVDDPQFENTITAREKNSQDCGGIQFHLAISNQIIYIFSDKGYAILQ